MKASTPATNQVTFLLVFGDQGEYVQMRIRPAGKNRTSVRSSPATGRTPSGGGDSQQIYCSLFSKRGNVAMGYWASFDNQLPIP
jgi:hypothetical protein